MGNDIHFWVWYIVVVVVVVVQMAFMIWWWNIWKRYIVAFVVMWCWCSYWW